MCSLHYRVALLVISLIKFLFKKAVMDAAIDISSSEDSDFREIDAYCDESPTIDSGTSLTTYRKLPAWASGSSSSTAGYNVPSRKSLAPKQQSSSDIKSLNINGYASTGPATQLFVRDGVGASTSRGAHNNDYFQKASSSSRGPLPSSFQPLRGGRSNKLVDNVVASNFRESYLKPHESQWRSLPNTKNHGKDHLHEGRAQPLSFMQSRYSSSAPFQGSTDHLHQPGVGEERTSEADERMVYQAALQDLNQPKAEMNMPNGLLSVPLLRHQKIALSWMLQKETLGKPCFGGLLADDQGLGKTISMIALIQMQRMLQEKSKLKDNSNTNIETLNLDDDDDANLVAPDKESQREVRNLKTETLVLDDDDDDEGSASSEKTKLVNLSDDSKVVPESSASVKLIRNKRPAAGTLVVCPASILQQWHQELYDKVAEEARLTVLIYHGSTRTKDPHELAKYDVVLTTYTIVAKEVPKQPLVAEDEDRNNGERYGVSPEFTNKKRKKGSLNKKGKKSKKGVDLLAFENDCGALAKVRWARVILDEAQTIKNHRTQVARACCSLRAKTRWCLSGTPIQNAIDELYSYFRFLRCDPYDKYKSFCEHLKFRIAKNANVGYKKLQAALRVTMLRRTKGTLIDGEPIITLPPKIINLEKVEFTPEERAFYKKLESDSRTQFKKYAAAGTVNQNYANILLMLLRLRQACDHPLLAKGFKSDFVRKLSSEMVKDIPKDMVNRLLALLSSSSAICSVCADPPEDAVVTMCEHVFCYQCVSDSLTSDDSMCPASGCKELIGPDSMFTKTALKRRVSDDMDTDPSLSEFEEYEVLHNEYVSSKINAVIEILQSHYKPKSSITSSDKLELYDLDASSSEKRCTDLQDDRPIKTIIFSQWTSMLDLLQISLDKSSMNYRRLDGTMTLPSRDKAVKEFNTNPKVTVMLMSLKAGNLGLNMVAACHVILLDLWWNPTTEDQAVDRAHRIGQTQPVTVSRLTIKETVEDRILALQEEKRKMVASAFGEEHGGIATNKLTVEDLRYLFQV
ncbi:hypothetical protein LIER_19142 [Lithospermum erythrorhizon]|uniref:Helicase-like transcription factor CHR28 n=1 Tax=Lithospermum erythrorhizon TaxID=34254 RepID=A0AAV3QM36_LITER